MDKTEPESRQGRSGRGAVSESIPPLKVKAAGSWVCGHCWEVGTLVAEVPGYLQDRNSMSLEAVTRRWSKMLQLPLDLKALRAESTEWELTVSGIVEKRVESRSGAVV